MHNRYVDVFLYLCVIVFIVFLTDPRDSERRHHTAQNLRYLRYIVRHKYFVFRNGLRTGAPLWRLIIHDWSKFTPYEWGAYRRNFYGASSTESKHGFHRAWLKHIHRNPHHWEHWCKFHYGANGGNIKITAYRMPEGVVREMVADWLGANRAINGKYKLMEWYYGKHEQAWTYAMTKLPHDRVEGHKYKMVLHEETRKLVEQLMMEIAAPLEGTL